MDARSLATECSWHPTYGGMVETRQALGVPSNQWQGDTCPLTGVVVKPWQGHQLLQVMIRLLIFNQE